MRSFLAILLSQIVWWHHASEAEPRDCFIRACRRDREVGDVFLSCFSSVAVGGSSCRQAASICKDWEVLKGG